MNHGEQPTGFLSSEAYVAFLEDTHPELRLSRSRLPLPSYRTQVVLRDGLAPRSWGRAAFRGLEPVLPLRPKALCLGVPFEPYDQSHLLDRVEDPILFAGQLAAEARELGSGLCFFPNVDPEHPRLKAWLAAGFRWVPSFPDMRISLDVRDFEDHLRRVHRDDRNGIRRNIKRFDRSGHRLVRLENGASAPSLYRAYRTFQERALVPWVPHTSEYFAGLPGIHPTVRVHGAFSDGGEFLGFVVNFWEDGWVQSGRIGVVPEFDRRDGVYFRLLYKAVEDAIESGGRFLSLEPTGYRTKRHLGARPHFLVNLLYAVSPFWKAALAAAPAARSLLSHLRDSEQLERLY